MRSVAFVAAAVFAALLSPSLIAQQGGGAGATEGKIYDVTPLFDAVDANHDGKITKEEWKAAGFPDQPFDMWEKDGQSYLTKEGFGSFKHPVAIDTNGDGKMTKEKMLAYIKKQHEGGATEGNSHGQQPSGGQPGGAPGGGTSQQP